MSWTSLRFLSAPDFSLLLVLFLCKTSLMAPHIMGESRVQNPNGFTMSSILPLVLLYLFCILYFKATTLGICPRGE